MVSSAAWAICIGSTGSISTRSRPGDNAADVQQIIDDASLHHRVANDDFSGLAHLLGACPASGQQVAPGLDRGQRRSQFMGEHGQELILQQVGPLRLFTGVTFGLHQQLLRLLDAAALADVAGNLRGADDAPARIADG